MIVRNPVKTSYLSREVAIPPTFLASPPSDPITCKAIDFTQTDIPEYKGAHAFVLDNVLSPAECEQLLNLAELSVRPEDYVDRDGEKDTGGMDPWQLARVNVGAGMEVLMPEYRRGSRIIWDSQAIVDRLWARIRLGVPWEGAESSNSPPHVLAEFSEEDFSGVYRKQHRVPVAPSSYPYWRFNRVNHRMRFLRYGPGDFFRPHCDGAYGEQGPNDEVLRTWFTIHLYLNDSIEGIMESEFPTPQHREEALKMATLKGGSTEFLSSNEKRKIDIFPRAGRVLIFQHKRLYHSGSDVTEGVKFTVRMDVLYEMGEKDDKREGEHRALA